jgi:putative hydrolase of the HAD superfamily
LKIRAVSFDIGHTLVRYNNPLNWSALYTPVLKQASERCGFDVSGGHIKKAEAILKKYNTRENPREKEVGSDTIFKEIFDAWKQPYDKLGPAKGAFYSFFQAGAVCCDDAEDTLRYLQSAGVKTGALTDAAYGMDDSFSLRDIAPIRHYFDLVITSVDAGYRKPNAAGFLMLLKSFDVSPQQMIYVGDEEKDIVGANALGIVSVLIDRNGMAPDWGQRFTIHSLSDIRRLL